MPRPWAWRAAGSSTAAALCVAIMVILLRFGPRIDDDNADNSGSDASLDEVMGRGGGGGGSGGRRAADAVALEAGESAAGDEQRSC